MTEKQPYDVRQSFPAFEIRFYPAHVVAEIEVETAFSDAGNEAFRPLAGYIGGKNATSGKVAMTAPVVQTQAPAKKKIAMTAPVVQAPVEDGRYVVSFVMPAKYTLDTLPVPTDERVRLREVPAARAAVLRYTGSWSKTSYEKKAVALRAAVLHQGLVIGGPLRWERFNPPWTPWFLRRNEVVAPLAD